LVDAVPRFDLMGNREKVPRSTDPIPDEVA
jgi:hypothetical protein